MAEKWEDVRKDMPIDPVKSAEHQNRMREGQHMDPRTAAKVTAPDLLEAFHESAPNQDVVLDAELRIFVILADGDEIVYVSDRPFAEFEVALQRVRMHLQGGGERTAFLHTAVTAPELWLDAQKTLSAPEA
jgi:hypothetical protein